MPINSIHMDARKLAPVMLGVRAAKSSGANARVDFAQRLAHTATRCEPTVGPAGPPA